MKTLLLALLPALFLQDGATPTGTPDDDPIVLDVKDTKVAFTVGRSELRDWLLRMRGETNALRFAQAQRVRQRLQEEGLEVTAAEVDSRLEEEISARISRAFGGDRQKWVAELAMAGRTAQGFRHERQTAIRFDLESEALARHLRTIGPEEVRAAWEERYGLDGISWDVRAISLRFIQPVPPAGTPASELQAIRERARTEVLERAGSIAAELRAGADFDALLARYADDPQTRDRGGRFEEGFPPQGWPQEALEAMRTAQPGDVLDPVYALGSFHVLRIDGQRSTPLDEELAAELARELRAVKPDAAEMMGLRSDLVADTPVVVLPALSLRGPRPADEPVLTIGGRPVRRDELGDWLTVLYGETDARPFAQFAVVERRAAAIGVLPDSGAARLRIESNVARTVEDMYRGDRTRWWRTQAGRFDDEEDFVRGHIAVTEHHLLTEALIRADRVISDDDVRARWVALYGQDGRSLDLRMIRTNLELEPLEEGRASSREELEAREARAWAAAGAASFALRQRIEEGEDFAALARAESGHADSAARGGQLGRFKPEEWPESVVTALASVVRGDLVGPLEDRASGSVLLFEVLDVQRVPFEEAAEGIRRELIEMRPTDIQRASWLNVQLQGVEVAIRPALYSRS